MKWSSWHNTEGVKTASLYISLSSLVLFPSCISIIWISPLDLFIILFITFLFFSSLSHSPLLLWQLYFPCRLILLIYFPIFLFFLPGSFAVLHRSSHVSFISPFYHLFAATHHALLLIFIIIVLCCSIIPVSPPELFIILFIPILFLLTLISFTLRLRFALPSHLSYLFPHLRLLPALPPPVSTMHIFIGPLVPLSSPHFIIFSRLHIMHSSTLS